MCIRPSNIWVKRGPKWETTPVPCKDCWRCRKNRVNDYVGRSLCEAQVSQHVAMVQLTYAPRHDLADKVITPRHFQLFMKLLRRAGHKVRYLVVGEYGSLKGRAHFHAMLFFTHIAPSDDGRVPVYDPQHRWSDDDYKAKVPRFCREIPSDRHAQVHVREWPHGHITCEWGGGESAARYVCEYLLSDDKQNCWFSVSKKPALGAQWFAQKAEKARKLGVLPSSFEYHPPGAKSARPFLITGATRRDYLAAIGPRPDQRRSMSEWVQLTFDKHEAKRLVDALEAQQAARDRIEGWSPPADPPDDFGQNDWAYAPEYTLWWLSQIGSSPHLVYDGILPHSVWPREGKQDGAARSFFKESGIFNPKPRPAPRAVSGYSEGRQGSSATEPRPSQPRPPRRAAPFGAPQAGDEVVNYRAGDGLVYDPDTGECLGFYSPDGSEPGSA